MLLKIQIKIILIFFCDDININIIKSHMNVKKYVYIFSSYGFKTYVYINPRKANNESICIDHRLIKSSC